MGNQIARKLHEGGHEVIGHDINWDAVTALAEYGITPAFDKVEVISSFNNEPVIVWVMIPAAIIDTELRDWASLLPKGSILIDGGNSDYRGDSARATMLETSGSTLIDIGTSGGVWGYDNGFSMMVGGDATAYDVLRPLLDTLAAPRGGHRHFGQNGSGHYVKMVHNAIEYGMMQSLAEGYRMLKEGPYPQIDLATAGDIWQESSVVTSWLNDLTRQALHENPTLDGINGVVAESGEARWTLETAKELGIPLPAIQASFDVRIASQRGDTSFTTRLLAAMRNKFGGHNSNQEIS